MADEEKKEEINAYDLAEQGWAEMFSGSEKIQKAANLLKKSEHSIDGYNIERALRKHKPAMIKEHMEGLKEHRSEQKR